MVDQFALAQSIGPKAAAKKLATQQGHAAIVKLLNDESVDLTEIVKAVITDGPLAGLTTQNQIYNLINDEKVPLYASIFYDTIDYIDKQLNEKKIQYGKLYDVNKHQLTPEDITTIQVVMAKCESHRNDLIHIKEELKFHDAKFTRESIKNWLNQLFRNEWATCTMFEKRHEYFKYLNWKMPPGYGGNSIRNQRTTATPRARKPTTKTTPKKTKKRTRKKRQPNSPHANAQNINLPIFDEVCWYHNWREGGCNRTGKCEVSHMCSIEGCDDASHIAPNHK